MTRVRLNLAALLLVCSHVTWGQGSQRPRRAHAHNGQHLCGAELTEMLVWICGDAGVHGKRSGSDVVVGSNWWSLALRQPLKYAQDGGDLSKVPPNQPRSGLPMDVQSLNQMLKQQQLLQSGSTYFRKPGWKTHQQERLQWPTAKSQGQGLTSWDILQLFSHGDGSGRTPAVTGEYVSRHRMPEFYRQDSYLAAERPWVHVRHRRAPHDVPETGIVEECCYNACQLSTLLRYCN